MSAADLHIGALVLLGADHWRAAPRYERVAVWALARRDRFDHLDTRIVIGWWRGRPYLVSIREAR